MRRGAAVAASETAIAHLVMGRLAVARHAAQEPVGGPVEHAIDADARSSELLDHARGIVKPAGGPLAARELDGAAEAAGQLLGPPAHAPRLRPRDAEWG